VDFGQEQVVARAHDLIEELGERVRQARERRQRIHAQSEEHGADVCRGERERNLHHRNPLLEPVVVHALQMLDVHQLVAHLDGVAAPHGQQVELVALLHGLRGQRSELRLGGSEAFAECTPLPAGDNLSQPSTSSETG
jgi:hypothetical protein